MGFYSGMTDALEDFSGILDLLVSKLRSGEGVAQFINEKVTPAYNNYNLLAAQMHACERSPTRELTEQINKYFSPSLPQDYFAAARYLLSISVQRIHKGLEHARAGKLSEAINEFNLCKGHIDNLRRLLKEKNIIMVSPE